MLSKFEFFLASPKLKKHVTLFLVYLMLTSCFKGAFDTIPKSWNWGFNPRPYMTKGFPEADTDYGKGFRDGCKSQFSMVAQGLLRNVTPEYDGWKMTSNPVYAAGFYDGEEHCSYTQDWDIT